MPEFRFRLDTSYDNMSRIDELLRSPEVELRRGAITGLAGLLGSGTSALLRRLFSPPWQAIRDGILLGRYARCDGAGLLDDPSMSRVHALLLCIDDTVLVVDTASRRECPAAKAWAAVVPARVASVS